jgi:hypothetical protein
MEIRFILTGTTQCPLKLIDISEQDRSKIIDFFRDDDCFCLNIDHNENDEGVGYFVIQLENDTDDVFYDHSTPFSKIFTELGCVCVGFAYQNEYGDKNDTNTAYAIWFEKIVIPTIGDKR